MPTDPQRVKELFVAALELTDSPARRAFIDHECAGDAELRARLDDRVALTLNLVSGLAVLAILALMIWKPGS